MEDLERVLRSPPSDQRAFLAEIVAVLRSPAWKVHTALGDPRPLYKALAYICAWLYFPPHSELLAALPPHIATLHGKLNTDVSSLKPAYAEFYIELCADCGTYQSEFVDVFTQPWTLALVLIGSPEVTATLPVHLLVPSLLFTLTYIPSLRSATATALGEAVTMEDGVFTLIQSFAVGESKEVMRDFAVKVLSAVPRKVGVERYWESAGRQCLQMLVECKCELYFRSIITDVLTSLLTRHPDPCRLLFLSTLQSLLRGDADSLSRALQALHSLSSQSPPPRLVLYLLESEFPRLHRLYCCAARYPTLSTSREVKEVLGHYSKHSDNASSLLYTAFISGFSLDYDYELSASGFQQVPSSPSDEPSVSHLSANIDLLCYLSSDPLSSPVCSSLFSLCLRQYAESEDSTIPLLYISATAESLPPEVLVESAAQLEVFLRAVLVAADEEMWKLALCMVAAVMKADGKALERRFLVDISKTVIELTKHANRDLAEAAKAVNSLISVQLARADPPEPVSPATARCLSPALIADLRGSKPFERAYALHQISLFPTHQLQVGCVMDEVERLLNDSDTFVFQNVLKVVLCLCRLSRGDVLQRLFTAYAASTEVVGKAHILELLFHLIISLGRVTIYTAAPSLMHFLTSMDEGEELLKNGKMSVMAELAKYLGPALHPYVHYMLQTSLSCINAAASALFLRKEPPSSLAPALLIVEKIMKNSPFDHVSSQLDEIRERLGTLSSLYSPVETDERLTSLLVSAVDSTEVMYAKGLGLRPL